MKQTDFCVKGEMDTRRERSEKRMKKFDERKTKNRKRFSFLKTAEFQKER